jgi:multiple sugar transport system substrate-binding protein
VGRGRCTASGGLADVPKEWNAFWSFWCDQVQPAVHRATGRDDIWGVGLSMSGEPAETQVEFFQFLAAYDAGYVSRNGGLVIDDPEVRRRLIEAIDAYTAVDRKGCTPPGSTTWHSDSDNNEQFSGAGDRHDAEPVALDPQRPKARAPGRLL